MASGSLDTVLHYLRRLGPAPEGDALGDAQLLQLYTRHGDEAAFAALVRRHGPLVWGTVSRMLGRGPDAEDAFQATFLVLVRKASALRGPDALGPWLYGVASRVALKARSAAARRRGREKALAEDAPAAAGGDAVWRDLRPVLDEEVNRLLEKYRAAVVLCYLEGLTDAEAARRLACPRGTVHSRLARARQRLQLGLSRRGVGLPAGLLAAALAAHAAPAAAPAPLIESAVQSSLSFGRAGVSAALTASAVALAQGALRSMLMTKLKLAVAVLLTLGLAGTGAGLFTQRGAARQPAPKPAPAAEKKNEVRDEPVKAGAEAPAPAPKAAPKEEWRPKRDRELSEALKGRVKFSAIDDPKATLAEVLDLIGSRFGIAFEVNEKAFAAEDVSDVSRTEVANPKPITAMDARLSAVLHKVLGRLPNVSGVYLLVRKDYIEITTGHAVRAEFGIPADRPLLPLVWESFEGVPLAAALQTLADDTDFNIVIDPQLAGKLKTPVTTTLKNVPVDTAVRLLAGMDSLRAVRVDNVFYITRAENADWVEENVAGKKPGKK
ncbi:MAG TPA: sigma-70 family RNA polymerase sigma factor [Gemmataceae bacterium]|nr:sigma-70 family RNA polymerase sigma factor [Gemmataceae bacterium]